MTFAATFSYFTPLCTVELYQQFVLTFHLTVDFESLLSPAEHGDERDDLTLEKSTCWCQFERSLTMTSLRDFRSTIFEIGSLRKVFAICTIVCCFFLLTFDIPSKHKLPHDPSSILEHWFIFDFIAYHILIIV